MKYTGFFLCGVLLICSIMPLSADTVMLYLDRSKGQGDEKNSIGYIEDGIMEAFFDAGHIIFNSSYHSLGESEEPEEDPFGDYYVYRVAKSGGASYVLSVRLSFDEDIENQWPISAAYDFVRLETEQSLSSGVVLMERTGGWKEKEPFELVQSLGKRLGMEALKGL